MSKLHIHKLEFKARVGMEEFSTSKARAIRNNLPKGSRVQLKQ
jgi:hypothetical protein